jgi:hypothetical protein
MYVESCCQVLVLNSVLSSCLRRFCPCISLPHARLQVEEDVSALLLWKELIKAAYYGKT